MRRAIVFALLATALAACGGGGGGSATASTAGGTTKTTTTTTTTSGATTATAGGASGAKGEVGKGCTFLTEAEAQAELGGPVEKIDRTKECNFLLASDSDRHIEVTVARFPHGGYSDAAQVKSQLDSSTSAFEKVSGLGDGAWFSRVNSELTVVRGDVYVQVQPVIADTSDDLNPMTDKSKEKEVATRLARTILGRL